MRYGRKPRRPIRRTAPESGEHVYVEAIDRASSSRGGSLTPQDVDWIMTTANSGDTVELSKLAVEIEEKNWDIQTAMQTRRNALLGCEWSVEPADTSDAGRNAAKGLEKALRAAGNLNGLDTFSDLISDMMGAVIAPFAISELIWDSAALSGFSSIEGRHFTLRDSYELRLITRENPSGMELPPHKFVVHYNRRSGGDMARGGLIRTLAWLHVFQNYPIKDWLGFAERFGMPFIVAKVDRNTYDDNRSAIHSMIRNFGPSGGGVFDRNTEVQLLQAATDGGNVYRSLLDYTGDAITKVLLGQTASSGDSAGLSGGDAQSRVRQDILEADARALESTITSQIAAPWTYFNHGNAPVPLFKIDASEADDKKAEAEVKLIDAQTIQTLASVGYRADVKEVSERFGFVLTYEPPPAPPQGNAFAMAAEAKKKALNPEVKSLADALDAYLLPLADGLTALSDSAELSDQAFVAQVAKLIETAPGDDTALAELMTAEMTGAYNRAKGGNNANQ